MVQIRFMHYVVLVDISIGFPYFLFVSHANYCLGWFFCLFFCPILSYILSLPDCILVMLFHFFLLVRSKSLTVFGLSFLFFFFGKSILSPGITQEVCKTQLYFCDISLISGFSLCLPAL